MFLLAATSLSAAGCGGSGPADALRGHLLSASDLPAGWSAVPVKPGSVQTSAPCLSALPANPPGWTHATAAFVQGSAIPALTEVLATGPGARQQWQRLGSALARCRSATITIAGKPADVTIRPLSFPPVRGVSAAYAWTFTFSGVRFGVDFLLFTAGGYAGYLTYADLGAPLTATARTFAAAATAKAERGSVARIPGTVSVASAPVRTVRTSLGTVGYRMTGSGPPLVMIMGYGGTMRVWDRRLIDALAQHHRVVIFDNAGIGETQALPSPLSIDAMANQTSALIGALGLGRPDVLGWSMGSMIAQALTALHPGQVDHLVLCASYPGDGTATRPTPQALRAFKSGNPRELFPADQAGAQNSYFAAISGYPPAPAAPASIVAEQGTAVDQWWAGDDPAGRQPARITVPTLIADGAEDQLDPSVNSRTLAALIPGARLTLFPDAGHAFLFQDQDVFVPQLEAFLA